MKIIYAAVSKNIYSKLLTNFSIHITSFYKPSAKNINLRKNFVLFSLRAWKTFIFLHDNHEEMFFNCFSPSYRYCGAFASHSHALITAITRLSSSQDDNLEESIASKFLTNDLPRNGCF